MPRPPSSELSLLALLGLAWLISSTAHAGKYALAYWYEVGAYQNNAPPAGEFGNHSAYVHVWNEDGSPRPGVSVYTSWGVLLGVTDSNGYFELPLNRPNAYNFQVRDGAHLSDTTPSFSVERAPTWGHYSCEIGFRFQANANDPYRFDTNYLGRLNASGTDPCRDLSAPHTASLAYHSTPTNYCGDNYVLETWADSHGQTLVATGNRVVAANVHATVGYLQHLTISAQILAGGPEGPPVGPVATSRVLVSDEYFPILIRWGTHDVQVVPGQTYYLKITRPPDGLNVYRTFNSYPLGQYHENGTPNPASA